MQAGGTHPRKFQETMRIPLVVRNPDYLWHLPHGTYHAKYKAFAWGQRAAETP